MHSAPPPDPGGEAAQILHALRHALADPLAAAALKLELIERRSLGPSGTDPAWVVEKVRAVQTDIGTAMRLLGLLPDLAAIAGECPVETSLGAICLRAGIDLAETPATASRLTLREGALADAFQGVASFLAKGDGGLPSGSARLEHGRVAIVLEGPPGPADGAPSRLLDLPHGNRDAEALFAARAAAVADGGQLELVERGGRLVAIFSWPLHAGGGPAQEAGP